MILIILSNDINLNPGPHHQNNPFNFISWNVNSLAKNNFQRVRLIEAHNSIFNYDLISICETSLNDSVELPESLLNYTFVPAIITADHDHMIGRNERLIGRELFLPIILIGRNLLANKYSQIPIWVFSC